jgi:hypothetical protein
MRKLITLVGATSSGNCVSSRYSSVTALSRVGTRSITPKLGRAVGWDSVPQPQGVPGRKAKSYDSGAQSSTRCYWFRLGVKQASFGIHMENMISTIVRIQGAIRSLPRATTVRSQPHQAWYLVWDSALPVQVVSGRKARLHDSEAYSRAREYWIRLEKQDWFWPAYGAYDFNNCADSRRTSVTASCQANILPTPSSGIGF